MGDEHLGLALEPAKGAGVDNTVPVALERGAVAAFRFVMEPPT
jgi:hypothetical protein